MRPRRPPQYITPEGYSPLVAGDTHVYEWYEDSSDLRLRYGLQRGHWMRFRGESGETGPMPGHRWRGTAIAFQNTDGSWGDFVELRGAVYVPEWDGTRMRLVRGHLGAARTQWQELKGRTGAPGHMPRHEVVDSGVRFERPDGQWGEVIPIRALEIPGPPGPPPRHEIDRARQRIRFENPEGGWGAWLELGSEANKVVFMGGGGSGGAAGPTPVALSTTNWNPATGTFPATSLNGQVYRSTGVASIDGVDFANGDLITALTANASTTSYADWNLQPKSHAAAPTPTLTDWDPLATGAFPAGSIKGQRYRSISIATVDGIDFVHGDIITAQVPNASTTAYLSNWTRTPHSHAVAPPTTLTDFDASIGVFPAGATKGQHFRANPGGAIAGVQVPDDGIVMARVDNAAQGTVADWTVLAHIVATPTIPEVPLPLVGTNYSEGIIEYFGKGKDVGGTWTNPDTSGAITLTLSTYESATAVQSNLVRRDGTVNRTATQNLPGQHFRVEFPGPLDRARIDGYMFRSGNVANRNPRSWQIRGSLDGLAWTVIDERINDTSLDGFPANRYVDFASGGPGAAGWWKFVEILSTGPNVAGFDYLELGRFEFFGAYREGDAVDTSVLQHAAFTTDGALIAVPDQTAVTSLPLFATVQPYAMRLLVDQAAQVDEGWWFASPSAGTWQQVPP
ncbi:MAG: hypothetical protein ACR2RB_11745 [Gammaproteobacteria bacterium]